MLKVKGKAYDLSSAGRNVENIYTFSGVRDFDRHEMAKNFEVIRQSEL